MTLRRTIFSSLALVFVFSVPFVAHSYSLIDLANDTDVELDINGQCSSVNIGNLVDKFNEDYARQAIERAKRAYLQSFVNYSQQWIMCIIGSIQVFGSGNTAKSCTSDVASAAREDAIFIAQTQFEDELVSSCTSQTNIRDVVNASRNILAQNGRDGGAAYVQDWKTFQADNRYRGLQIARNEMANTRHCPWVSSQLQAYFNYDASQAVSPQGGNDGQDSYMNSAACTLPDDFDPLDPKYQTLDAFAAMMMPQNNIAGAYLLAQAEIQKQIADEELAAQNEFAYTGGIGGLREPGRGCEVMAADGSTCLQYSKITQPAGGVLADVQAQRQAQYDLVTNPQSNKQAVDNVVRDLAASLMSIDQPLAPLQYKSQRLPGATPAPTPAPTNVPGSGDEGDPLCTGGNPDCHCAINNSSEQQLARGAVLSATQAAAAQHPDMLTADGVSLLPGMNVPFLQAVCQQDALKATGNCRANNAANGLLITVDPIEINIDIILPSNVVRQPGVVTLVCTTPGTL